MTISAGEMSKSKGGTSQNWVNRFFGSFFFIFQLNQLFGNLISSLVIQGGFPDSSSLPEATEDEIDEVRQRCGLSFKRGWHKKHYIVQKWIVTMIISTLFKSFWLKFDLILDLESSIIRLQMMVAAIQLNRSMTQLYILLWEFIQGAALSPSVWSRCWSIH